MPTVKIDFGALQEAVKKSRVTASEMIRYADAIPKSIDNPLGNLVGGASSLTSGTVSLAAEKRAQLKKRADGYKSFAAQTERFSEHAQAADKEVKSLLIAQADRRAATLNRYERLLYDLYKASNGALGNSRTAAYVKNMAGWGEAVRDQAWHSIEEVRDWFKHGNGRYVLNIGMAVGDLVIFIKDIGSYVAVAGALFLLPPPIGIIAGVAMLGATALVLAKKSTDVAVTSIQNGRAISENATEPGLARYHGSQTSMSDYAKKETTDRRKQNFWGGFDSSADIADFALGFTDLLETGKNPFTGEKTYINGMTREKFEENLLEHFGFESVAGKDGSSSVRPKTSFPLGLGGDEVSGGTVAKKGFKLLQHTTTFGEGGFLQSHAKVLGDLIPEWGSIYKAMGDLVLPEGRNTPYSYKPPANRQTSASW